MKPFVEVTAADLRAIADLLEAGEVYVIRYNSMLAVLRPEAKELTPEVCMCGHEQFHHDPRKCWVHECTCRGFRPDPRANERTQPPTVSRSARPATEVLAVQRRAPPSASGCC